MDKAVKDYIHTYSTITSVTSCCDQLPPIPPSTFHCLKSVGLLSFLTHTKMPLGRLVLSGQIWKVANLLTIKLDGLQRLKKKVEIILSVDYELSLGL